MQVLKYKRKTSSKIDLAEKIISIHCVLNNIHLNSNSVYILACLMVYGASDKTKRFLKESGVFKNPVSVMNVVSSLRKKGLLLKERIGPDRFCEGLDLNLEESKIGLIIKLENDVL